MCNTQENTEELKIENDNKIFKHFKNYLSDNTDKVIKTSVFVLSFCALLFAVIFWAMDMNNNVILFAVFSCGVSTYGLYLAMSDLDDTY